MSDNYSIDVRPLDKNILVDIYDNGSQNYIMAGSKKLYMMRDDKFGNEDIIASRPVTDNKHPGIRPRWAVILATSKYAENSGLKVGDKVFLDSMKWSRGIPINSKSRKKIWRISVDDVLGVDENGLTDDEKEFIRDRDARLS